MSFKTTSIIAVAAFSLAALAGCKTDNPRRDDNRDTNGVTNVQPQMAQPGANQATNKGSTSKNSGASDMASEADAASNASTGDRPMKNDTSGLPNNP